MRVFVDANVILDKYDKSRPFHKYSVQCYEYLILNSQIFTSCDLITTIYYVNSKCDKEEALFNIQTLNKTLKVIEFSNKEIEATCRLMLEDFDYKDLEDTIQYIMAKKYDCDMIISNDENFISKDIKLLTSKEFCDKNNIQI
jgi:predicted nucleic acid-binding protein